jgi:hypothetical protein
MSCARSPHVWLVTAACFLGMALASAPARAAEPWTPVAGEKPTSGHEITAAASDAYCKYLHGIADSDRALQMWPTLFASGGLVNPVDVSGASASPAPRLTAGASYSFGSLYRGGAIGDRADAECATYRRFQELLGFIARNKEGLSEGALLARAKVYDDALPAAVAKVEAARTHAKEGRSTVEDVLTLESKLDALRLASIVAKQKAAEVSVTSASEDKPLPELLSAYMQTEKHAEEAEASVRKSFGWDVSVRGGYDQVFGVGQKVPAFALATVSVNMGLLFQGSGNEAAIQARPVAARWSIEGGGQPAVDAVRKLREVGIAEAARLEIVNQNVTTMEAREKAARAIENEKAQIFADYIFFDLVQARAEQAFLRAHLAHIATLTLEPRHESSKK